MGLLICTISPRVGGLDCNRLEYSRMPRARSLTCSKCGTVKVVISSGATRCPVCHNRRGREYYRTNLVRRENQRRSYILRKYGISIEQLEDLLSQQEGSCAICRRPWQECVSAKRSRYEARFLHHLCVDHDHATGRVRGLLCNACNTAIGMFEEDRSRFESAAEYLERHAS